MKVFKNGRYQKILAIFFDEHDNVHIMLEDDILIDGYTEKDFWADLEGLCG